MPQTQTSEQAPMDATSVRIGKPLWRRVRIKAAEEDTTVTAIVEAAVTRYLEHSNGDGKSKRKAA